MTHSLSDTAWINAPETVKVMAALEAAGKYSARFVGGCVRNTLRGARVDDIDIATQLTPDKVMAALRAADIRAIPTGLEHGTVTAVCNSQPFEITTLRRDVETDGRRAVVAFTEDWAEDAARRDFRLNAIYADAEGALSEFIPGGIADAEAGRVIFIGDPDERLREDYLRILRFFRFNAWYGAGIDPDGLAACERQRQGLKKIAAERIWKELRKLLAAPDPAEAVMAMEGAGVLAQILPNSSAGRLPALVQVETAAHEDTDAMQRFMALLPRRTRDVIQASDDLKLSNAERGRLLAWADAALMAPLGMPAAQVRAAIYRHGEQAVLDRALIEAADSGNHKAMLDVLSIARGWTVPKFPVGGADALDMGLSGPVIGQVLADVEDWWVAQDFGPDRVALLTQMKNQLA
jgi:poly(A) polymerase